LIFQLVILDPCIAENVAQIDVRVEFPDIFHVVPDQSAIVERIMDATVFDWGRLHLSRSYGLRVF
jgi:hypothetical protein